MITGILASSWFDALLKQCESFAAWACRAGWQAAALAMVVALLHYLAGKRFSPSWRFALWLLVLARLAMPPLFEVNWKNVWTKSPLGSIPRDVSLAGSTSAPPPKSLILPGNSTSSLKSSAPQSASTPAAGGPATPPGPAAAASAPQTQTNWNTFKQTAIALWLSGIAVLFIRIAWSALRLARAVARTAPITQPRLREQLRLCCRELGISKIPEPRELPGNGAPALVGFVRPRILLPPHVLQSMADDELRLILLHELAHIRRRDVLINWLATLICVIHWLNPAAWLVAWRMRVERELACDELVLRLGRDRGGRLYAKTIVKLVEALSTGSRQALSTGSGQTLATAHVIAGGDWRGRVPASLPGGAVGILEGKAQIQRRLLMIARFDSTGRRPPVVAAALALLIGAVALCGATKAADKPPAPGEKSAKPEAAASSTEKPKLPKDTHHNDAATIAAARSVNDQEANKLVIEKLKTPVKIQFDGVGLSDALDYFRDVAKVDIVVDWAALEAAGIPRDAQVNLRLRDPISADNALALMFRAMGGQLRHEIDKGVVIVSPSDHKMSTVTCVYDVSDLISGESLPAAPPPGTSPGGSERGGPSLVARGRTDVEQLVMVITSTVQPETWTENTISVFKTKLVVKAPENVQREVASLLQMLHDKPDKNRKPGGY